MLDVAWHLVLPCLTLVAAQYGQYALVMRSSMVAQRHADYVLVARAKGRRDAMVRDRHAVPNALPPVTSLLFMHLGAVVSGAITVETVFSWPGLGLLTFNALSLPDLPVLQGTFLVFSCAVIVASAAGDVVARLLDPRVAVR